MAEFTADFHSFRPSFPFIDIDCMELTNQFKGLVNPQTLNNNSNLHMMQNLMMPFTRDNSFMRGSPEPDEFSGNLEQNFSGPFHYANHSSVPASLPNSSADKNEIQEGKKRKATTDMPDTMSANSTPAVSESGSKTKTNSGRGKRVKRNETEEKKKPMEVVHVRARRGQATDSHSLAERVRRGKINEKLKCLQNIVPGCYKTMGMAIMLDEIINYVQSLQHQVEFLSMKLTAASAFYDFNSETDALETMQRERASEAKEELPKSERSAGYGLPDSTCFQPTWPNWSL